MTTTEWIHIAGQGFSPRTKDLYARVLGEVEAALGPPTGWTIFGVSAWLQDLTTRGCSPATRHTYLQAVRSFCRSQLPDLWAQLPKRIPHMAGDPQVAHQEDIDALYASPQVRPALKTALLLMADGGLRECEVRALRWDDVDLVNEVLLVHGKGSKLRRVAVPSRRLWENLAKRAQPVGYVVPGRGGNMLSRGTLSRQLAKASEVCTGKRLPAHAFRHGFAVRAAETVPMNHLQRALGHASLSTTAKYLRSLDGDIEAQRKAFEAFR